MQSSSLDVERLPDLLRADAERDRLARTRQAKAWQRLKPDLHPILLTAPLTEEQEKISDPNFQEAFDSAELMLCSQIRAACQVVNARSDAVPSIRVNFGTATVLSCLGLEQAVFPDKMPWLRDHLSKGQLSRIEADDIQVQGTFARGLQIMRRFKEIMGDSVAVYCMDTQGPFDLAHLAAGDQIFYDIYDDPGYVHHVMEVCLQLGIKTHIWMKQAIGECTAEQHHGNALFAQNMGIRICEDTTALLSPGAMGEFALPYTRRLAQCFGGAWVHYCGRNDHLSDAICQMPEIRGINFGHIPGHVHQHSFQEDMHRCGLHKKVCYGSWPRLDGESGREYLRRLFTWADAGVLIPSANDALLAPEGFRKASEILDYWYSL